MGQFTALGGPTSEDVVLRMQEPSSLVGPPSAVNCPIETGAAPGAAADSRTGSGAAGAGSARSATTEA